MIVKFLSHNKGCSQIYNVYIPEYLLVVFVVHLALH